MAGKRSRCCAVRNESNISQQAGYNPTNWLWQ
jgi:hypothetical protein